jgi:hypothetical protein
MFTRVCILRHMSLAKKACGWCGRELLMWRARLYEPVPVVAESRYGRAIVAVRVPGGATVVDVRDLAGAPAEVYPEHRCSEWLSRKGRCPVRIGG